MSDERPPFVTPNPHGGDELAVRYPSGRILHMTAAQFNAIVEDYYHYRQENPALELPEVITAGRRAELSLQRVNNMLGYMRENPRGVMRIRPSLVELGREHARRTHFHRLKALQREPVNIYFKENR